MKQNTKKEKNELNSKNKMNDKKAEKVSGGKLTKKDREILSNILQPEVLEALDK